MQSIKATNVDEYISSFPEHIQVLLQQIRKIIQEAAPEATEKISYAIPTFFLNGNLVHFAGYEHHIGFYPGAAPIELFGEELTDYKCSKGTIQFPLTQALPVDLIARIVDFRVVANLAKKQRKSTK